MSKCSVSAVIAVAQAELKYLEKASNAKLDDKTANAGSGNYTKYWRDLCPSYQGQPWCNCWVNWIFIKAFSEKDAKRLLCTSGCWSYYTPTSAQYFKDKKQWVTKNPQPGDVIYFKNSSRIHHVGIVYKVDSKYCYTYEGNTSQPSGDGDERVVPNGGGVFAKKYSLTNSNIAGYGRPKYDEASVELVELPIVVGRAGLEIMCSTTLNVRKSPVDGAISTTYKKGAKVQATAKAKASDGVYWFKTDKGWISGKYVQGWVQECCGKWWYVKEGYKYDTMKVCKIDGCMYAFDDEGWLITQDRIDCNGVIS